MTDSSKIRLYFLGAAGTVTGSKFLIDTGKRKILIDCGLFQGLKKLRELNWEDLPVNIEEIDTVLLTHGHLDHTGYLPRLVQKGFNKTIWGTAPTLDVAAIILRDSAKIQEEEAEKANSEGYSKHEPAKPLYTLADAEHAIAHLKPVAEGEWLELFERISARFLYVGHIIGATYIEMDIFGKRFVFSGDVGRKKDLLLRTYKKPKKADVILIESTYGDRLHPQDDLNAKLTEIILHTIEKGGTLIIPSFAVERAQLLMYLIWKLREHKAIPDIPLILDSPMGANVLHLFRSNREWHKLSEKDYNKMCKTFRIVEDYKETWEIIDDRYPKIIIAGSGMLTGGRVLTYLQHYIHRPETTIMIVGYQAEGTRGRKLIEGATELKIYGEYYDVRAEIFDLASLSAHADQAELIDWLSDIKNPPEKVYLVHGENHATDAFRVKLKDRLGWNAEIPELYTIEKIKSEQTH